MTRRSRMIWGWSAGGAVAACALAARVIPEMGCASGPPGTWELGCHVGFWLRPLALGSLVGAGLGWWTTAQPEDAQHVRQWLGCFGLGFVVGTLLTPVWALGAFAMMRSLCRKGEAGLGVSWGFLGAAVLLATLWLLGAGIPPFWTRIG